MKSKIFNTDQVRAIQEGRMNQFMQVVKWQPQEPIRGIYTMDDCTAHINEHAQVRFTWQTERYAPKIFKDGGFYCDQCPFGKVGDVIAVRETWQLTTWEHPTSENYGYIYKATDNGEEWGKTEEWTWHPSATMPREAARLFLRITNIRVMRVQELTEEDAKAQGYGQICECKNPVVPGACENCYNTGFNYPPLLDMQENNEKIWNENSYMWIIDYAKTDKP